MTASFTRVAAALLLAVAASACKHAPLGPERHLELTLRADQTVQVGQSVPLTLTITNTSDQGVSLFLTCSPSHIEVLLQPSGAVFYRSWEGPQFGCGTTLDLGPRESETHSDTFDLRNRSGDRAPPGTYRIRASLRDGFTGPALVVSNFVTVVVTE